MKRYPGWVLDAEGDGPVKVMRDFSTRTSIPPPTMEDLATQRRHVTCPCGHPARWTDGHQLLCWACACIAGGVWYWWRRGRLISRSVFAAQRLAYALDFRRKRGLGT